MSKDLEKENKKLKKKAKRSGKLALILLLILLIILLIFLLFKPFGFGMGLLSNGTGGSAPGGSAQAETSVSAQAADTTAPAENDAEQISYIDVTIKDAAYICDGEEITLDDLIARITARNMNTIVRLHNDNGIIDAYDKLTAALEQNSIPFEKDSSFDVE